MNKKQLISLTLILAFLILGVIVKEVRRPAGLATRDFELLNLSIDSSKALKILIGKGNHISVTLVKQDGVWLIPDLWNARADQAKVENLLALLKHARGEKRAEGPELLEDFGITDDQAYSLAVLGSDNQKLLEIKLAWKKAGPGAGFIRRSDSNAVYLVDADLIGALGLYGNNEAEMPKLEVWPALDLIAYEPDQISRIEITRFSGENRIAAAGLLRMDSKKNDWSFIREDMPFRIDQQQVKDFLRNLSNLRARQVYDPSLEQYGFDHPYLEAVISAGVQGVTILTVGQQSDQARGRYVKLSNEPVIFEIPNYHFSDMNVDNSRFAEPGLIHGPDSKIQSVVIHRGQDEKILTHGDAGFKDYLGSLKRVQIKSLIFDQNTVVPAGESSALWIEITDEKNIHTLYDFGAAVKVEDEIIQYPVIKRGNGQAFMVSAYDYQTLIEQMLAPTPATEATQAEPAVS
ncbi:MAG: DUF4340 domain-containing protein [Candidatus Omnitrophica bacterium]|nr:DUF4340 domain-containing protein [Candidatus Omnitrophota bacterium]